MMYFDFFALRHQASCIANWLCGGPRHVTFSAWSFHLLMREEDDWRALVGAWRVQVIDAFFERLTGREFHCLDAWMRELGDKRDG